LLLELGGTLLGLVGPLKMVRDYLKGAMQDRTVGKKLRNALQSLNLYENATKASDKYGKALYAQIDGAILPMSLQDAEELVRLMTQFCNSFSDLLHSTVMFGRECNLLISGDVEGFMGQVKTSRPEVHDFITTFGKNYNSKTDSLDLSSVPMLMRIYGLKQGRRENLELLKEVAEGKKKLSRAMEKAEAMKRQKLPRIKDRHIIFQYSHSLERMAKEGRRLTADRRAIDELSLGAPSWIIELTDALGDVQKAFPGLSKRTYRTDRVPGFRTCISKTGHRK
jgi:hypothetical protein